MGKRVIPNAIKIRKKSRCVAFRYGQTTYELSFEMLRVYSPSAEVRGHGVGNEVLQYGKKDVVLLNIEAAGNYALKLIFDDGHDSGLYDWSYLKHLCENQEALWQEYLKKLNKAGQSRTSVQINFKEIK